MAAVAWMALYSWRFGQVLHWMREGDWANEPNLPHVWQLLVNKIRRLQKNLQSKAQENQSRLDEFLLAIQASPNGVMLLDSDGRIACGGLHQGLACHRDSEALWRSQPKLYRRGVLGAGILCSNGWTG